MADPLSKLINDLPPERRALLLEKLRPPTEPIAVVGLACRFPGGASGPDAYWKLLADGVDAISEVPPERWDADEFYDAKPQTPGKMYTRWGGFIDNVDQFDAAFFGISPREAARMDPQQRLLLEVSWEALENAGLPLDKLGGSSTGVFVGVCASDYSWLQPPDPALLDAYSATGNAHSIVANRISYAFDLQGPSMAVDTACSSSLASIHLACQSLWTKECEVALAGGVHLILSPLATITFSNALMMAADGRCKTFDAAADGFVRGEGCGVVVLKRLSDALANGDSIWALVRGTAVNQDGRTNGLMAPNGPSQQRVIRKALEKAGVQPGEISYVEAHGTGTSLGDPIEVEALAEVLGLPSESAPVCAIGSVKTNFGHLEGSAGIAGFIKVVLALHNGFLPPHLHFRQLNPHLSLDHTRFKIPLELAPWNPPLGKRFAGVSSFGFGGTNAHVVLEDWREPAVVVDIPEGTPQNARLLMISARHPRALAALAETYRKHLTEGGVPSLQNLCYSAAARRSHHNYRLAAVGRSNEEMARALEAASGSCERRQGVCFVFSGQGSQWVGMGREMIAGNSAFRERIEQIDKFLTRHVSWSLLKELSADEPSSRIDDTEVAQPAIFAVQVALVDVWRTWGITPDAVMGHSLGEIAAAHVAGALSLEDAVFLVAHRGRLMQAATSKGAMAAVELPLEQVEPLIAAKRAFVTIAAMNSPISTVISGDREVVEGLVNSMHEGGIRVKLLPVNYAFHSHQMDPVWPELVHSLSAWQPSESRMPFFSTVTGKAMDGKQLTAEYWGRNIRRPVRLAAAVDAAKKAGLEVFLEVGPHPVLAKPIVESLTDKADRCLVTGSLRRGEPERLSLLKALGALYTVGHSIDSKGLFPDRGRFIPLPGYVWQHERHWIDGAEAGFMPMAAYRRNGKKQAHPLYGTRLQLGGRQIVFEACLNAGSPAFLKDHRLHGMVVVPAVAYFEMMFAAGLEVFGPGTVVLEDLMIREVLVIPEHESVTVQLALVPEGPRAASCEVFSRPASAGDEENWKLHVSAKLAVQTRQEVPVSPQELVTLPLLKEHCRAEIPVSVFYQATAASGFEYGPSFRAIERLWVGEQAALGCIPLAPEAKDYQIHPATLEGCLQVIGALADRVPASEGAMYIPIGVESLRFFRRVSTQLWSHATMRPVVRENAETITGDVRVFDEAGDTIAEIVGLQFKRTTGRALRASREVQSWLYEVEWRPALPSLPSSQDGEKKSENPISVIFDDGAGTGSKWREISEQRGISCCTVTAADGYRAIDATHYELDPANPDHVSRLFTDLTVDGRLPSVTASWFMGMDASIGVNEKRTLGGALHVGQVLSRAGSGARRQFWIVTRASGICGLRQDEPSSPIQAPLWGLGRTLALEHPEIWGGLADLSPDSDDVHLSLLADDIHASGSERMIAFRDGQRLIPRLVRLQGSRQAAPAAVRSDATYLISGGHGALGKKTAEWLIEQGARHIAVFSRKPEPETLSSLATQGAEIRALACDVAELQQVEEAMNQIRREMPPLRGVIHAAGVLDDGLLLQQNWQRFEGVLAPKARGAWNLHVTAGSSLDFFVMFSSAASVFGSPGQSNYCAANTFLDAFSQYRSAKGLPSLVLNWGPWAEVGMAARTQQQSQRRWAADGIGAIPPDQGVQALASAMRSGKTQVLILPIDWSQFLRFLGSGFEPPFFAEIARQERLKTGASEDMADASALLAKLSEAPPNERRQILVESIQTQIAHVTGALTAEIAPNRGFFEMGMDSLMALDLKNRLQSQIGQTIPATLVFEYPTIDALTDYLLKDVLKLEVETKKKVQPAVLTDPGVVELLERLEGLSDSEASALVEEELARNRESQLVSGPRKNDG